MSGRALALTIVLLIAATALETTGDAIIRNGIARTALGPRLVFFGVGAAMLFGYGLLLNLAPVPFERVVGIYIATLFVMWQVISAVSFRARPDAPVLIGGALIVAGGLIVAFWSKHEA